MLPAGWVILWDRHEGEFFASLYYQRGTAIAETTGEREVVLLALVGLAQEMASDCCIDLTGLPPAVERFAISAEGRAITCWTCGRTSYHPEDVRHRYCGACSVFHG